MSELGWRQANPLTPLKLMSDQALNGMIIIVFDKNLMRAPAMEEFLAMDRNHAVALSDWTIIEMQKKNALTTSRESLAIAAKFPDQVFTLRPVGDILDDEVRSKDEDRKSQRLNSRT